MYHMKVRSYIPASEILWPFKEKRSKEHYWLEWQALLVSTQYPFFFSFPLTAYAAEMCQSKIIHFTVSFAVWGWLLDTVLDDGI